MEKKGTPVTVHFMTPNTLNLVKFGRNIKTNWKQIGKQTIKGYEFTATEPAPGSKKII